MVRIPENVGQSQFTGGPPNLYTRPTPVDYRGFQQGAARLSAALSAVAEEKANAENETAVLDAYTQASKAKNEYLYHPEKGVYAQQGMNALGSADAFEEEVRLIGENAAAGLNPQARTKFDKMWQRSNLTDHEGILKFQLSQAKQYKADTGNALVDTAVTNAVSGFHDPEIIKRSKSEILGAVLATYRGQSEVVQKEALLKSYSAMHKGIVQRIAAESPARAEEYYKANKDEITGGDHVAITNFLRSHLYRSSVLKQTEQITQTSGSPVRRLYETLAAQDPKGAALMSALTQQESGFRPTIKARNPGNRRLPASERVAVGLTQVLVNTAREISSDLGDGLMEGKSSKEVEKLLENPQLNLRYGTHYLNKQLKRYNGDLEAALIAYNAGPGNADKFLRAGRDYAALPDRKQTEPYVANVLAMFRRNLQGTKYAETAGSLERASVIPAATDAELDSFREVFNPKTAGTALVAPVENGAAQLWDFAPPIVRSSLALSSAGGDLLVSADTAFAKEWVTYNAPTVGLSVSDEGAQVRLTAPSRPETVAPQLHDEYDYDAWIQEADRIEDPTLRSSVMTELAKRHSAMQQAKHQDSAKAKEEAWRLALDGEDIPLELKKQLTPEYLSSIERYQRRSASGGVKTDWAVWLQLRTMSKEQLTEIGDAMLYREKLADPEFKQFVEMIRDARGVGDPSKNGLAGMVRTRTQIVKQTLGKAYKNNPEGEAAINKALDADIEAYYATYGKQPDATQIQTMVDRLLLDAERSVNGWVFGSEDVKLFQMQPGEFLKEPLVSSETEIPLEIRESARVNAKVAIGRDFTQSELLYAYSAALAYKRGAFIDAPDSIKLKLQEMNYPPDTWNTAFAIISQLALGIK